MTHIAFVAFCCSVLYDVALNSMESSSLNLELVCYYRSFYAVTIFVLYRAGKCTDIRILSNNMDAA
jgi:hypothetical protein